MIAKTLFALLPLTLLSLTQALPAQDPPTPPGGFNISWIKDTIITWSDGYKSTVDIDYPTRTAPKTGWPVVAVIHGASKTRKSPRWQLALAGKCAQLFRLLESKGDASRSSMFKNTDVAIVCRMGWDDFLMWISNSFDNLDQMKKGVPYKERYIVGGTTAVRGKTAGVHKVSFDLRDVATIVPKGVRLVLRIENLA